MIDYIHGNMTRTRWMFAGLIVLTLAVYWPVHRYEFIELDDADYVADNPHVHAGFNTAEMKYAFTTFKLGNWNPLLWMSFYADRSIFGIRPGPMHVENVLLHLIAGLLVWRLLLSCTGDLNRSFIVAALFLMHPMHVESVAWISERKDVLSTPLLIVAMLAYVRFCRQVRFASKALAYVLMIVLFALSLMAKSMGVTLPAVLLLMDFWPIRRYPTSSWTKLAAEKLPLFAIAAASVVMAHHSQQAVGAAATLSELGIVDRIDNAIVCYVIYIAKLIVPINLSVFYQHPGSRPLASVFASAGLLVMATILFVRLRKFKPYLIVGWLWFLGTLVPVIGFVQVGGQAMADRYSYFPSIGFFIAIVWALADVMKNPRAQLAFAGSVLIVFTLLTAWQVTYWQDNQTLFTHAAQVTDDNPVAHDVLGHIAYAHHDLKRAVDEYNLACRYRENSRADDGLGNCWIASGLPEDRDKAIRYYRKAILLDRYSAIAHVNLAAALRLDGNLDEAREQVQQALTLEPDNPLAYKEVENIHAAAKSHHD